MTGDKGQEEEQDKRWEKGQEKKSRIERRKE